MIEKGFLKPLLKIASGAAVAIDIAKEDHAQTGTINVLLEIASSTLALQTLLYVTSSTEEIVNTCVDYLLDLHAIPRLVELILDLPSQATTLSTSSKKIINTALSILANLTRTERGALELVGTTLPDEAVYATTAGGEEEEVENHTNEDDKDKHVRIKPSMELLLDRFMNNPYRYNNTNSASGNDDDTGNTGGDDDDDIGLSLLEPHEWDAVTFQYDPYQHFASILMNATQVKGGRQFLMRIPRSSTTSVAVPAASAAAAPPPPKSVLQKLIPIISNKLQDSNPFRRRGIAGMIRNLILDPETGKNNAWWFLNICGILTPLLLPLMGSEELTLKEKTGMDPDLWLETDTQHRDYDVTTRLYCVESVLALLATGFQSRKFIRQAQAYTVLKICDLSEDSELISDRIAECVNFLRRDEENSVEGSSDDQIYGADPKPVIAGLLEAGPSTQIKVDDDDFDDVD